MHSIKFVGNLFYCISGEVKMATLFVGNLTPVCNEDMIGRSFIRFGDIQKSKVFFFKNH